MRASLVLLVLLPLLLAGLVIVPLPVTAAPVFFEEDFRGCADGTSPPPGWTRSGSTTSLLDECQNLESFPNVNNGTLPGFGPIEGDTSFRIRRSDFSCCPVGSHTASFSPVSGDVVTFGFAFRYTQLGFQPIFLSDACENPGAFMFFINEAFGGGPGICVDGDDPPDQDIDSLFVADVVSASWVDTGVNLVNHTWYRFRFVADRTTDRYDTYLNETLIDSSRRSGSADDWNTVTITTRGSRIDQNAETDVYLDWFFVGDLTVNPIPDLTIPLCSQAPEETIWDVSTDATTDVFFGLVSPPSFLSIVPGTGRLFFNLLPPEGPPPVGPTFAITVKANVSSGQDVEPFDLTFTECDPFAWIREFGPAWVLFLAFVAIFVTIGITLWRGAKGKRRR